MESNGIVALLIPLPAGVFCTLGLPRALRAVLFPGS